MWITTILDKKSLILCIVLPVMVSSLSHIAPSNKDLLLTELSSISYSLYDWMRRLIPKSLISIGLYIIVSPILFVLALILLFLLGVGHLAMIYLNLRLKRMILNDIAITYKNYSEARASRDVLEKMQELLDKLNNHPGNDLFLIKPYVNQAKKTYLHLVSFSAKMDSAIKELDTVNYSSSVFNHITQDELWANRSKGYKYIV